MTLMTVAAVELAVSALGTFVFLVLYGNPNRHPDKVMAWHVYLFTAATGLEAAALLLLAVGVALPAWLFLIIFAGIDAVVVWRLVLFLISRRLTRPRL